MSERVEDLSRRLAEVVDGELTPEQIEGWNRCVDSIPAALALWLEDENRL